MTDEKAITVQTNVSLGTAILPSPAHVVSYATEVSKSLSTIIQQQRLFSVISGRKYVQVEGWTTMGAMLGVVPRTVSVEEIMEGVFEATVELVRVSDGAIIGRGIAECGSEDEVDRNGKAVWASRARYARKSMAITRATGKAYRLSFSWIMKLAGYEATPWEEMAGVVEGEVVEPEPEPKPAPQRASKPKPTQPAASAPPPWTEGKSDEDKPHWIDKPKARAAFWAYTKNELGLTPIEVHEALGVESVKDYTGTMEQAKERLDVYADEKSGQEQEPLFPPAA